MATTYGVSGGNHVRPWRNVRVRHYGVDSGETIQIGEAVCLSADANDEHLIKACADNPTAGILGFAAEAPPSGYAKGYKIPVWIATEIAEFLGRQEDGDAVDLADIGTARALEIDATNDIWCVETSDAGNDAVRVHGFVNPETNQQITADGDFRAGVIFSVVPGARVYGSTSST